MQGIDKKTNLEEENKRLNYHLDCMKKFCLYEMQLLRELMSLYIHSSCSEHQNEM